MSLLTTALLPRSISDSGDETSLNANGRDDFHVVRLRKKDFYGREPKGTRKTVLTANQRKLTRVNSGLTAFSVFCKNLSLTSSVHLTSQRVHLKVSPVHLTQRAGFPECALIYEPICRWRHTVELSRRRN